MRDETYKYWAFISYSHRDQAWAEWLHHALETYRVPRRLVGRKAPAGAVPRRLFPVFRDQEELPSSPDLSGAIDEALRQSRYLIVIASPYAAVSKWVDQEIARFRALGRGDRILCLIVDGEPHADLQPGKGLLECFPPALRNADTIEPIAADVRPGKDGKAAARLKLTAGLLGVGLDELRQRERRRRLLQNLGAAAVAVGAAVVLGGLWLMQQREKHEALEQQRLRAHVQTVYENGRQELLDRNQARAAVYLAEAYRLGVDTPALRFMLSRAMRIVEAERAAIQTGAPISSLRFSPDGKLIYSSTTEAAGQVWDVASAKRLFGFSYPWRGRFHGPRFSRNGRFLYVLYVSSGSDSATLAYWDAASGQQLGKLVSAPAITHTLNPFGDGGRLVAHLAPGYAAELVDATTAAVVRRLPGTYSTFGYSRDGRWLFSGEDNGTVKLWSGDGARLLRTFSGLGSPVTSIDNTEDDRLVGAAGKDGSIRAWLMADGGLRILGGHPSPNPWLIFSLDGSRLFTGAADGVRVWNTTSGALVYAAQRTGATGTHSDISSDGRWLMQSGTSRLVMQDIQSGRELFTLDGNRGLASARDISDDDSQIATGGSDGRLVLWKTPAIPDVELRHPIKPQLWDKTWPPGVAAAYSPDGGRIATGAADGMVRLWDASSHAPLREMAGDPQSVNLLSFSRDGRQIVSAGESSGLKLWDADSGAMLRSFPCDGKEVLSTVFDPSGGVAAALLLGGDIRVWNLGSGEPIASFSGGEDRAIALSPDGRHLAIAAEGQVRLWDPAKRQFEWSVPFNEPGTHGSITALDFSADGRRLLAAGSAQAALMLDSASGAVLARLHEPSAGRFVAAKFDAGGHLAAFGADDGTAVLWWPDQDRRVLLRGHAGEVRDVAFSPDDVFVLTAGVDGTVRVWDSSNGELLDVLGQHGAELPEVPFHALSLNTDGSKVLSGSVDGVVREWRLGAETRTPEQIAAVLRCRVPWVLNGEELAQAAPDDASCAAPAIRTSGAP